MGSCENTHNHFFFPVLFLFLLATTLTSFVNYLLFHTIAELFSIVIGCLIFMIAWTARDRIENSYLLYIGVGYLFIAGLDLLHTLAFKGMNIFAGYDANLPTQLWIAARSLEAATLLIAAFLIPKKVDLRLQSGFYFALVVALIWSIFTPGMFPDCFIEGSGLTPFKIYMEYLLSTLFAATIVLIYQKRAYFEPGILHLMIAAIGTTIIAELAFTFYIDVYGLSNLIGHLFKIISFALIYLALVETGIRRPLEILYRDLSESEGKFRGLFQIMKEGFALHEIIRDDDGNAIDYRIREVNPAFEEILSIPAEGAINKTASELYGAEEPPFLDRYAKVADGGEPITFEEYFPERNKYFSISVFSEKPGTFATIFTDITRTILDQKALHLANKKLNLLTSLTRHDIFNNITAAEGFLYMIDTADMPPDTVRYFNGLREQIKAIERKNEFSRDYQNMGIQAPLWQSPEKILKEYLADHTDTVDITIEQNLAGYEIFADPMLPRVVENLIGNALIHGKTLTSIRWYTEERGGSLLIICEDDGVGVVDEKKQSIFKPAFGRNHGFGLYLVCEILSITGITIRENGVYGEGARFEIEVPADGFRKIS
ncbi:PAS domain-containing protein [Methanocalculus taiwanensis]|uniref:histidine kinase n=1 Tax=Methanocalculus taiwanensis TaxID=106207 RepID=A0ABD4TFE9_9EURY|nr:MASE3 domain-containing protein [Methanocalculus taiwanensis]MCQ1537441.1 PAS domain-containing protein [Methanocalculus taiwanensis]